MQKGRAILVVSMAVIFLLGGCATNRGLTSSATVSLVNYINQGILMIAELEQKSLERYASVTGKNYTTDEKIVNELKDFIIPTYQRFADGLKAITPEDEEIQRVHAICLNAADLMCGGFKNKLIGIENNNEAIIIQANENIEKARDENERWRRELKTLYQKYGVTEVVKK
jgi:uncharacterized protein YceK